MIPISIITVTLYHVIRSIPIRVNAYPRRLTGGRILDTNKPKLGSDEDELLSVADVGTILGVSKPTVYDLLHHGVLNSLYIGRLRKVPRSSLKNYIKEQLSNPALPSVRA